jgi:CBS domain-containing protein
MHLTAGSLLDRKGTDVVAARPHETVYACIDRMVDHNVGSILVVDDDGRVVGIFTERDYLRRIALEGRTSRTTRVDAVMTRDVIAVSPAHTVDECLSIMTEAKCRHLPVVSEGSLLGIVSIGDCVKQRSRAALAEVDHLESYIQTFIMGRYPA